jgi:hypothetical protein
MPATLQAPSDGLLCGTARPDGATCVDHGCWRNCWVCSYEIAENNVAGRLTIELEPHEFRALVDVEWHDFVSHRMPEYQCEIVQAEDLRLREIAAAKLAEVPDDGQPRPLVITTAMVHRADCSVVTGRGTFWRQYLTTDEALATMLRHGGGPIYKRCQQCAPDVPEARKVSRLQARIERGEHVKSGLGWPE